MASHFFNLGLLLETNGRLEDAIANYRQATLLEPEFRFANFKLGNALMRQGKFEEAATFYAQELRIRPDSHETINNLASALQKLGRLEKAIVCYQKALSLNPSYAEAYNNLGVTYNDLGRLDEAIAGYRQAIHHNPGSAEAYSNLANTLTTRRCFDEAVQLCKQAIALEPNHGSAHLNLGNAYRGLGFLGEAVTSYERAIALMPDHSGIYSNLGETFKDQGKLGQAFACFEKAVSAQPVHPSAYSNLLYFCAFTRHISPAAERALAVGWERALLTARERMAARERGTTFALQPRKGRKLRLGVLTAELGTHAFAEFLEPVLEELDRSRFDLIVFPTVVRTDSRAQRFRDLAQSKGDGVVSLWGVPAAQAAERIRSEQIDILVETTGHTYDNRLDIIAHRAAPVQCSYIGYWSTTGVTEMDWFITGTGIGPFIDSQFSERLWRLPRLAFSYKSDSSLSDNGWAPDPDGTIWLGSYNNNAKIREETLGLWAKVLHALPQAKLLFEDCQVNGEETHQRIRSILAGLGVAQSRICFIPYVPGHERHLKLYDRLDIALDTIPFNSVTTAFDALWMGVPLITLAGTWMGGMMAGSIVSALGHPEWIAQSEEEYAAIVCTLARDVEHRKQLRKDQRLHMAKSELCDANGMASALGDAFEAMYDQRCDAHAQFEVRRIALL